MGGNIYIILLSLNDYSKGVAQKIPSKPNLYNLYKIRVIQNVDFFNWHNNLRIKKPQVAKLSFESIIMFTC